MGRAAGEGWFTHMDKELRFICRMPLIQEVSTLMYYYDITMDS